MNDLMESHPEYIYGVIAALLSPLLMTIGFIFWDKVWKGSAIMLNLIKCSLASLMFLAVIWIFPEEGRGLENAMNCAHDSDGSTTAPCVPMLFLSAFVGITIGDNVWLQALKDLGARRLGKASNMPALKSQPPYQNPRIGCGRVILVDATKPFFGAIGALAALATPATPATAPIPR